MFNLSPIYSACKSSNHKLFKNHKISPVHKFTWNKTYTNIKHKIFEELVPSVPSLLKKHIRLGQDGIVDHSVDLSIPDSFLSIKKERTKTIKKSLKYYINAKQQIPVPYGSMLRIPPTNLLLLAAKQESYQKAYHLMKNIEEFSGKSSEERASRQKKIRYKGQQD